MKKHYFMMALLTMTLCACDQHSGPKPPTTPPANTDSELSLNSDSSTTTQAHSATESHKDKKIAHKIKHAIHNDEALSVYAKKIRVHVQNGEVTLTGTVDNSSDKSAINTLVTNIHGVTSVSNQLNTKN